MHSIPRQGLSKKAVDGFLRNRAWASKDLDLSMLMRAPNDLATLRNYYAQVSMVDDGVGEIMQTLDDLSLAENTLLIFTTDHGLSLGHHGFWGRGAACFPSNLHHAAHSIPLIVSQKGVVDEGKRSSMMVSNMDLFATILIHAGITAPNHGADGPSRDLSPLFAGDVPADWGDDVVCSEQEETRVVRTPKWALFKRFSHPDADDLGNELYDVEVDPTEANNLAGDPAYVDIERALGKMIDVFFEKHARADADPWQGGVPLQNSVRTAFWREVWGEDWEPVYRYGDG